MKIQATWDFNVSVTCEFDTFESTLTQIQGGKEEGTIKGTIQRANGQKTFIIDNSDLHARLHGVNLGFQFYVTTIKKCFDMGAIEIRSSTTLNEHSIGVWNKIQRLYYNCSYRGTKRSGYYVVTRSKDIL